MVPRHPPCALHSLSQQRQNNSTTKDQHNPPHHHTHHQPPTTRENQHQAQHAGSALTVATGPIKANDDRCSRPLSRSQTTTPPTPHTHQPADTGQREAPNNHTTTPGHPGTAGLILQDPTVCHHPPPHQTRPTFHTHTPEETQVVLRARPTTRPSDSSTIPLVNTTMRPHALDEGRGVCSFERR